MRHWIVRASVAPAALAVALVGAACSSPSETVNEPAAPVAPVDTTLSDARITTSIQGKYFASDLVSSMDVNVDTSRGVVTLNGSVPNEQAKTEAVRLAREVDGVTSVNDELVVSSAQVATNVRDEKSPGWITTKIQAQYYAHPGLKPWNVDVTTSRSGVVTLSGTIDNESDRAEAVRIARGTDGVTDVHDRLRSAAPVATSGSSAAETMEKTGEAIGDAWITAKVQSKYFLDGDVKGRRINVDTNDGVVTLKGEVDSFSAERRALSLARSTDGVKDVRDELTIQPEGRAVNDAREKLRSDAQPVEDAWITTKLRSKLFVDADTRAQAIGVETSKGVVTLTGSVPSTDAKKTAEQLAKETDGVTRVVNRLTVVPRAS